MAQVCFSCGKKSIRGHLVSHAKNRVVRSFKVNLQGFWVMENGKRVRAKFCVKCLRKVKRAASVSRVPSVPSAAQAV